MQKLETSFSSFSFSSERKLRSHTRSVSGDTGASPVAPSELKLTSSPHSRRPSFLSPGVLGEDSHNVYDLRWYNPTTGVIEMRFSLTLAESQGFVWNQDLFASPYQQQMGRVLTGISEALSDPYAVGVTEVTVGESEDVFEGITL